MHGVWDYALLASRKLDEQAYVHALQKNPLPLPGALDPAAWASESCKLVDSQHLYPKQHKMDQRYLDAQRPLAEQRVEVAAKRLSDLLNATLTN